MKISIVPVGLSFSLLLSACNGVGVADFAPISTGGTSTNTEVSALTFAGITTIDQKTDTSLRINWTAHADAVAYDIWNTTSGTPVLITTVIGQSSHSYSLSALTSGSTYKFRVRARAASGNSDLNTNDVSVTLNSAPDAPVVALNAPSTSPGVVSTPQIHVSGVKSGDTVKLYSDGTCVTLVGTSVATGTSVDITSSALTAGTYAFAATSTNASSSASTCSASSVTYIYNACPSGYVAVPANSTYGVTSDFCVMKYEAKNVGSVATSQAALGPWTSITQINAKNACLALGAGYDLISNPEWMTIATNMEKVGSNWSGGIVGAGALYRGNSDANEGLLSVTDPTNGYDQTNNTASQLMGSGREQRRNMFLSNGQDVWDMSGNAIEMVDWTRTATLTPGPTTCASSTFEMPAVSCTGLVATDYLPGNPLSMPAASYNSSFGLGAFVGGAAGYAMRGAFWASNAGAGIFSIWLSNGATSSSSNVGFRCVYRP